MITYQLFHYNSKKNTDDEKAIYYPLSITEHDAAHGSNDVSQRK